MLRGWRIIKAKYADAAFTGDGAAEYGGRWNSRGTYMVYCSSTQSLAALELLVHLVPPVSASYAAIRIEFPESLLQVLEPKDLPPDWREYPVPPAVAAIGTKWVRSQTSAILQVPSVIIPAESNLLINPMHPDFYKIRRHKPEPFTFDPRLIKQS